MTIESFGFAAPFAAGSTDADETSLNVSFLFDSGARSPVSVTDGSIFQPSGSSALTVKFWFSADWLVTSSSNVPSNAAACERANAYGTMSTSTDIVFATVPLRPVTVKDVLPRARPAGPVTSKP